MQRPVLVRPLDKTFEKVSQLEEIKPEEEDGIRKVFREAKESMCPSETWRELKSRKRKASPMRRPKKKEQHGMGGWKQQEGTTFRAGQTPTMVKVVRRNPSPERTRDANQLLMMNAKNQNQNQNKGKKRKKEKYDIVECEMVNGRIRKKRRKGNETGQVDLKRVSIGPHHLKGV